MFNFLTIPEEELLQPSFEEFIPIIFLFMYFGVLFLILGYAVSLYIFKAISVFKMGQKLNIPASWLAFIPYTLPFAYGRIAEKYDGKVTKKPIKFSIWLLILQFVPSAVFITFYILLLIVMLITALSGSEVLMVFAIFPTYFVMIFTFIAVTFVVNLFNALASWNVFSMFGGEKTVLYFILSLTLGIEPFLLFAVRNNEPVNVKAEEIFTIEPFESVTEENDYSVETSEEN